MDYRRLSARLLAELRRARHTIQDTSERLEEWQSIIDAVTHKPNYNMSHAEKVLESSEKQKPKFALVANGKFYYVGENKELTEVPADELYSVIRQMKFVQTEHYARTCAEPTAALTENREYKLGGEELDFNYKLVQITVRDEQNPKKILHVYEYEMPDAPVADVDYEEQF